MKEPKSELRHRAKIDALNALLSDGEIDYALHYDRLEPLAIQMDSVEYGVGTAYGMLLEHVGAVHILCAAALEAHVNIRGEQLLSGRHLRTFERLALDAKWLFLPPLCGLAGFGPGAQPFQGFDRLVKIRNRLVHYKPEREEWHGTAEPPGFLVDLGLTMDAADESLTSARGMVCRLASQLGEREPWWLGSEHSNFFEVREADDKLRGA